MPRNAPATAGTPADAAPATGGGFFSYGPGLLLTAALAALATLVARIDFIGSTLHLGPVVVAILLGALLRNVAPVPAQCQPGIRFSLKTVLGAAIVLLGFELSVAEVLAIGGSGLAVVALVVAGTLVAAYGLARALGLRERLSLLLAAGCAICGTSAIVAADAALGPEDAADRRGDAAYAVAIVSALGTAALFAYPLAQALLHLPPDVYGMWAGASIHSVGQAVAAGFAAGPEAGQAASLVKLTRVVFIAPVTLGLSLWATRRDEAGASGAWLANVSVPWFVVGFLGAVAVHSTGVLPGGVAAALVRVEGFLLAMAMAAMGLEMHVGDLRARGLAPLGAGLLATGVAAALALALATALHG